MCSVGQYEIEIKRRVKASQWWSLSSSFNLQVIESQLSSGLQSRAEANNYTLYVRGKTNNFPSTLLNSWLTSFMIKDRLNKENRKFNNMDTSCLHGRDQEDWVTPWDGPSRQLAQTEHSQTVLTNSGNLQSKCPCATIVSSYTFMDKLPRCPSAAELLSACQWE